MSIDGQAAALSPKVLRAAYEAAQHAIACKRLAHLFDHLNVQVAAADILQIDDTSALASLSEQREKDKQTYTETDRQTDRQSVCIHVSLSVFECE